MRSNGQWWAMYHSLDSMRHGSWSQKFNSDELLYRTERSWELTINRHEAASPDCYLGGGRCCYKHDCCYEGLHSKQCHPYIDHYRYLIINDDVICEYRNNSHCAVLACECDRHAALCFRKYAKTYNKKYHRYPYVLCKETTPKCRGSKKPK
ncbi:basic phospholipase A2 PLA-B-like [Podarcis lilfordi]|uniref:Phospholipase A2 n=1 Tax=Podarcis lilfordi TaxID=74358 RepID=A0AA35KSV8_9SAUR|nr:basic phospholipase A2 PLA-B-like [Podarcis lilfordi]